VRKDLERKPIKPSPSPTAIWFWQKVGLRTHEYWKICLIQWVDRLPMFMYSL